jgi:DNA-binding MarR family transcriptional regulator
MPRSHDRLGSAAELSGCTCLRLRMVTRRVTQIYDRALEQAGVTGTQLSILGTVQRRPQLGLAELAEILAADPTTMTRNLRPLERRRLVKIVDDPQDRRRRAIVLTREGRSALEMALPHWRRAQKRMSELLGAGEVARMNAMMERALPRLADSD